ncbi:MAG: prepilin-type N-terminal cleavage/methylation domain-containing protein [Proteobacteria bacterium]|nr:prepilin-type N-terminal cleavage/methylation domain-containing protein [Pseudomonadota bacterium]
MIFKKNSRKPSSQVRPRRSRMANQCHGFTLIEILVAIFIFSLAMSMLFTSFNSVFSSTAPLEEGAKIHSMAKNCFSIMTSDLMSFFTSLPPAWKKPEFGEDPDPYAIKGELVTLGTETFAKLKFSSLGHIPFHETRQNGISEIIYYVAETMDGNFGIKRFDQLYPHETFEESERDPVICEQVRSFEIRYFDEEGEEFDHWDSETEEFGFATPSEIFVKLAVGNETNTQVFETSVKLSVCRKKL